MESDTAGTSGSVHSSNRSTESTTSGANDCGLDVDWTGYISYFVLNVALVLFLLGFSSPYWVTSWSDTDVSMWSGIWTTCYRDLSPGIGGTFSRVAKAIRGGLDVTEVNLLAPTSTTSSYTVHCDHTSKLIVDAWGSGWVELVQATACISLTTLFFTWTLISVCIFSASLQQYKQAFVFGSFCSAFTSAMFGFITVLTYGVRQSYDEQFRNHNAQLSWCYILVTIATCLILGVTCLLFANFVGLQSKRIKGNGNQIQLQENYMLRVRRKTNSVRPLVDGSDSSL